LDRIDLHIEVPKVSFSDITKKTDSESSSTIQHRVQYSKKIQADRFRNVALFNNADMNSRHLKQFCQLDKKCEITLKQAVDVLGFSARACHSVLRVARTIADLAGADQIEKQHLAEAIQFRSFDRAY